MMRTAVLLLVGLLAGCEGPSRGQLDSAYATSISYLLEARASFFPGEVRRICLADRLGRTSGSFRDYYVPVSVCDDRAGSVADTGNGSITLWATSGVTAWQYDWDETQRFIESYTMDNGETGFRPEPYPAYWWRRMTTRPPRSVSLDIWYSDTLVEDARFSCLLLDLGNAWWVQACEVAEVHWRAGSADVDLPDSCWRLEWFPLQSRSTDGLPHAVRFSASPGDSEWDTDAYALLPGPGSDDAWASWDWGEHWALGAGTDWRWGALGDGVYFLRAGGGYEGIGARVVVRPGGTTLYGAGEHWTDVIASHEPPTPDWRIRGQRTDCT
jgi:hypothetical protein